MPQEDNSRQQERKRFLDRLREQCLDRLSKVSSDKLCDLDTLSTAPASTISLLALLYTTAVNRGSANLKEQGLADQFKVNGRCDLSKYEANKNYSPIKVATTTMDWYGDGTMAVTTSNLGLHLDLNTIEGLYCYVWAACIEDARNSTVKNRLERNIIMGTATYSDNKVRKIFEKLCLNCAKKKDEDTDSDYCIDRCRTNFWKWCKKQSCSGGRARTSACQKKLNKNRDNILKYSR